MKLNALICKAYQKAILKLNLLWLMDIQMHLIDFKEILKLGLVILMKLLKHWFVDILDDLYWRK
jgi:hypothetical protein